jgi:CheY-like chemotaxis protein/two-component sensor histidine kinase
VEDLLDLSRIIRGKLRLKLESLDFVSVVAQAVETSRPLLEARNHVLRLSVPRGPIPMRGDAARLAQVIANLLNNAAKYTAPGGRVELSVTRDGTKVELTVRDNGNGIDPSMLTRVFDPFTQAHTSLEGDPGGLGIGLTLVKRLVEQQGGEVVARSEGSGKGSEFILRLQGLPISAHSLPDTPWPAAEGDDPRLRILVVDDNPDTSDSLARLLTIWGHTVRTAGDGVTALDLSASFSPDVILLDLGLPRLSGLEVARRLREAHIDPPSTLVAMTGFAQQQDRLRTAEAGFDHHLVKPVDVEALRCLLAQRGRDRSPAIQH